MARVVFLGTPEAAVPTLRAVARDHDVPLVVTQPDRPKGRSKKPVPPPVKEEAVKLGIEFAQPTSATELLDALDEVTPIDLGIVVAYGRILRPAVLKLPVHGLLNVHFSLLPRWRGAAPVARALMAGDPMTGVTIIRLDEGLDTGPVLTAQAVDIASDDTAGTLTDRLASLGARLLSGVVEGYLVGNLTPVPQVDEGLIYADKIEASDRPISRTSTVEAAINKVRGLAPEPAATLIIDDVPHKIFEVRPIEAHPTPGTWQVTRATPVVGLSDGGVELVVIQPPGKNPMSGSDWVRGRQMTGGKVQ